MKHGIYRQNHFRITSLAIIMVFYIPLLLTAGTSCFNDNKKSKTVITDQHIYANPFDQDPDPARPDSPLIEEDPASPIHIVVSVSRTSGVAPLAVFFDATSTTGLTDTAFFSNNASYMDATFSWNFDVKNTDPEGKYERGSGFVAAHVFEHPGTYRVHLNVYDAAGFTQAKDFDITVTEFTGTTYHVASDGSDSNDGSIDHPFLTPSFALTGGHMKSNTRILFRRGDTFNTSQIVAGPYDGPVIIDSYEDPEKPSAAKPVLYCTDVNQGWMTLCLETHDWRVMNLSVRSGGISERDPRYPDGIVFTVDSTDNLKYRTTEHSLGNLPMSPWGNNNTIAECEFYDVNGTGFSDNTSGTNDGNALIGNWIHDNDGDHTFRLQGGSRYFIAHNRFGPNIKVNYDALTIRGNSEGVVIYKNRLEGWGQCIWPQNRNSAEEYQHHCIFDSNLIMGQVLYDNDRQGAIALHSKDIVIRNNIIYDYEYGVGIGNDSVVGPSQRIKVYNNTFINPRAETNFFILNIDSPCSSIDVKNNLVMDLTGDLGYNSFIIINDGDALNGTSDNNMFYSTKWDMNTNFFDGLNLADWQKKSCDLKSTFAADPPVTNTVPASPGFCMPRINSSVIDSGENTPAFLDYNGNLRDGRYDIGACEY